MAGPVDLIVSRGKVITVDPAFSLAEAVAVRGEHIVAVGGAAEIEALAEPGTRQIDAGGRAVMPGLIDGHAHLDREGLKPVFPSLAGCRSIGDVLGRIEALVAAAEPGEWIVTMPIGDPPYYWDVPKNLAEARFPTRWELDRVAPDNPVYIRPIWGFWRHILPLTSVANSMALRLAGIGRDTVDPSETIKIGRDTETGEPNGIIDEHTFMPVVELSHFQMAPRFTAADRIAGIKAAMRIYNSTGTTSTFEEHGAAQELIQAYQAVHSAGAATVRTNLMFSPSWGPQRDIDYTHALRSWSGWLAGRGLGDGWLAVGGMYTEFGFDPDSVLRARSSPYTGWSGFNYDCGVPKDRMVAFLVEAARNGIRVVMAANSGPALNDITFDELNPLLQRLSAVDPVLADLLTSDRITTVATGTSSPLIDLSTISDASNAAAADSQLIILEGMGRGIESNWRQRFTCDVSRIALVKDECVARWLGCELFQPVCRFDSAD